MSEPLTYSTVAQAVGEVSIWWSGVEDMTHALALRLAELNEPSLGNLGAERQIDILLRNMNQRQLFGAVKALAFAGSPTDLYPRLEAILNDLHNNVRPERNRFAHDSWSIVEGGAKRVTRATKIVNVNGAKELRLHEAKPYTTFDEIDALVKQIKGRYADLAAIFDEIGERLIARIIQPQGQRELRRPKDTS